MSKVFKQVVLQAITFTGPNGQLSPQQVVTLPLTDNKGFNLTVISELLLAEAPQTQKNLVSEVSDGSDLHTLKVEFLTEVIADAKEAIGIAEEKSKQANQTKHRNDLINNRIAELQDSGVKEEIGEITDIDQLKSMRT